MRHPEFFPVDVNTASKEELLRVPGIGVKSVLRILSARRSTNLCVQDLKRIGVVLKRAKYFICCKDLRHGANILERSPGIVENSLVDYRSLQLEPRQLSLFESLPTAHLLSEVCV